MAYRQKNDAQFTNRGVRILYDYYLKIWPIAAGMDRAYEYHVEFAEKPDGQKWHAVGTGPTIGAVIDKITEWRESVLDDSEAEAD